MNENLWRPKTSRGGALLRICERAFLADPDRTYSDLVDMGNDALAAQLKVDYQTGRLAENVPGAPQEPAEVGPEPGADGIWSSL